MSRVSVALCTYNGAPFLQAQLDSIAAQSRLPDELVACDDGSTDATLDILATFSCRAPFPVRIERNPSNLGSTGNFARAIGLCTGALIATCDQDDVWMPEKIALSLAAFDEDPRRGLVFTDAEVVDEKLQPRGYRLWESIQFGERERRLVRRNRAFDVLLRQWAVTGATMMFRTELRSLVLPIPGVWVHDGWIAFLVGAVAPIGMVEVPTVLYRQHSRQQIGADRLTLRATYELARQIGPDHFRLGAERFRLARERMREFSSRLQPGVLRLMDAKVAHQELRLAVSENPSRLARVANSLLELSRGGYSRFSPRASHVLKDMFL